MNSNTAIYTGFEFEMEGFPCYVIVNTELKKLQNRFQYDHSVFIEIVPAEVNESGHPEGEEYDYLIGVEKKILSAVEDEKDTVHVGHTTLPEKREIIIYTKNPDKVRTFLQDYLPTIGRENTFDIAHDPMWENVEGFYEQL